MSDAVSMPVPAQSSSPQYEGNFVMLLHAIRRARRNFSGLMPNKKNSHFKNRYADLSAVYDAVVDALDAEGVLITHTPTVRTDGRALVVTTLTWLPEPVEGEPIDPTQYGLMRSEWVIDDKTGPQERGISITYGKRYSLIGMLCLTHAEKDDDAEGWYDRSRGSEGNGSSKGASSSASSNGTGRSAPSVSSASKGSTSSGTSGPPTRSRPPVAPTSY